MFGIPIKKRVKHLEEYTNVLGKYCTALKDSNKRLLDRIEELESKIK